MKTIRILNVALLLVISSLKVMAAEPVSHFVQTPYAEQQVVFDFYFDEPEKINSALYWIRSLINPLMEEPYGLAPEFLDIKVIIHGTEIVTVARKNYKKYQDAVERMRYYASLGVEFKVCGLAAQDYDYATTDFYDFIDVVPSAITELAHWQLQGYALIAPEVKEKKHAVEEIR
jgi:intracellular sulfur oxidation DsrE/DsrF family protein